MKVVTIAGLPGSGSTTTAKLLSKKLDLNYFSAGQLFKDIALGTYKDQHYFPEFDSLCKQKNITMPKFNSEDQTKAAAAVWSSGLGKSKEFHEAIDELQIALSKKGNMILDGKLSLHMIKDADCKIWLHSTQEERARRAAERDGLDLESANHLVKERTQTERDEWLRLYNLDSWEQEKLADIVIETTNKTPEQVTAEILETFNAPDMI